MPAQSPERQEKISSFLQERITAGDFPSAVYLVAQNNQIIFSDALGQAVREPAHAATSETIYDLASLTKPLVTGLLCARLIELGELTLDSSLANYLGEFDRADKHALTLRQLLVHTSGLPAWRPLYITSGGEPEAALGAIASEPLEHEPDTKVVYSDLNFIVLGLLLERLTGKRLAVLARKDIFEPLGLKRTFFNPDQTMQTEVAASEVGNAYERDMCKVTLPTQGYSNWRSDLIWGQVHDGNANFLGGAAGHAGLFSTARETLKLANQFLGDLSELLNAETCQLFRTNMTPNLNEARSIAWQLAATKDSIAGPGLPGDAFGHSGFTGTSCWIDPNRKRVFILLTNRTHARALPFANINSVRRQFHSLAVAVLDES
ncbi:MAG: serine hydrolase domain-containing protein [Pyrinomonadaceae bacterium]